VLLDKMRRLLNENTEKIRAEKVGRRGRDFEEENQTKKGPKIRKLDTSLMKLPDLSYKVRWGLS